MSTKKLLFQILPDGYQAILNNEPDANGFKVKLSSAQVFDTANVNRGAFPTTGRLIGSDQITLRVKISDSVNTYSVKELRLIDAYSGKVFGRIYRDDGTAIDVINPAKFAVIIANIKLSAVPDGSVTIIDSSESDATLAGALDGHIASPAAHKWSAITDKPDLKTGVGLDGGGSLNNPLTLKLSTPATITETSKNAASSNTAAGHSHAIDKASTEVAGIVKLNDTLASDSTTEALTAAKGKLLDEIKAPILNPVFVSTIAVGKVTYPAVNLTPTVGQWGVRFEASNSQAYFAIRLTTGMESATGQKCVFHLPISSKDGTHTFAMLSDLTEFAIKGTTLAAYGISDAYKSSIVDNLLGNKVDKTVNITTGAGLTGGGALSSSRSLAIDKASATDLNNGTANKVLTTDVAKTALDNKANRIAAEISGSVTVQEAAYPSLRLISTQGDYGILFETSGNSHAFYVRPKGTINSGTGQIASFGFPAKTGNHIIAMTSDLPGNGLLGTIDLNTMTKKGIYGQEQNLLATAARNYPYQEAGYLTVADGPYGTIHEYVTVSGKRAIRYASRTDGGTWNGWMKLTTLSDYAITDAYTKSQVDTLLSSKANLSLFANLFTGSTGYQRLPSANGSAGMIIQAGTATVGDNQIVTVTLPIAFPNQFLGVVGMGEYGGAISTNTVMGTHGQIISLSQFKLGVSANFDGSSSNTSWIAIGR